MQRESNRHRGELHTTDAQQQGTVLGRETQYSAEIPTLMIMNVQDYVEFQSSTHLYDLFDPHRT